LQLVHNLRPPSLFSPETGEIQEEDLAAK